MDIGKILLVEDNPDDVFLTLRTLKKCGITDVMVIRDGVETLDFLYCKGAFAGRDPGQRPAFILLDLKLPKIDGIEVLETMYSDAEFRKLPVIVLSSSREESDVRKCLALGARCFLNKPLNPDEFREAMDELKTFHQI